MTKKNLLNKIKSLRFNHVIWPLFYYLLFLLSVYIFRGALSPGIILNFVVTCAFLFPIIITIWIVLLFRKNYKEKTLILSFLYCVLPGFIFGMDIAYGFYAMGHSDNIIQALPQLILIGLIGGTITGLLGFLINFTINLIKRT
jgi:hypothetical protein